MPDLKPLYPRFRIKAQGFLGRNPLDIWWTHDVAVTMEEAERIAVECCKMSPGTAVRIEPIPDGYYI